MKDLIEKILNLRKEISDLNRSKRVIQHEINKKEERLEELEKLTENQLDLFES